MEMAAPTRGIPKGIPRPTSIKETTGAEEGNEFHTAFVFPVWPAQSPRFVYNGLKYVVTPTQNKQLCIDPEITFHIDSENTLLLSTHKYNRHRPRNPGTTNADAYVLCTLTATSSAQPSPPEQR